MEQEMNISVNMLINPKGVPSVLIPVIQEEKLSLK